MRSGRIGPSSLAVSSAAASPVPISAVPSEASTSPETTTSCSMSTEPLRSPGSSTSSAMEDPDVDMALPAVRFRGFVGSESCVSRCSSGSSRERQRFATRPQATSQGKVKKLPPGARDLSGPFRSPKSFNCRRTLRRAWRELTGETPRSRDGVQQIMEQARHDLQRQLLDQDVHLHHGEEGADN